jgi:hypothetical protein
VGGTCGVHAKVYEVLAGKSEGKRTLGRLRRRSEYGIKIDLREIGWGGFTWRRIGTSVRIL